MPASAIIFCAQYQTTAESTRLKCPRYAVMLQPNMEFFTQACATETPGIWEDYELIADSKIKSLSGTLFHYLL